MKHPGSNSALCEFNKAAIDITIELNSNIYKNFLVAIHSWSQSKVGNTSK